MKITLDIPDADAGPIVDGLCAATGWTEASGKTKAAWAKDKLVAWIKDTAKRGVVRQSMVNAAAAIDPVTIT